jgi:PAS domain S-box-containing protein
VLKTHYVIHGTHEPLQNCFLSKAKDKKEIVTQEYFESHLQMHIKVSSIPVYNNNEELEFFVTTIQDTTLIVKANEALKDNEKRLELALEGAYEGMWDWNIQTGDVVFSDIWAEMLGYNLEEIEPHVNSWDILLHPDDKEKTLADIQQHLDGKTTRYESEHRLKTKSGDYKWILDRGQIVEWDENGKPLRAIGTHIDISRQKQIEKELIEAMNKAETADKLKSAFLSNMSHEIRTPMNGIIGFTELLSKKDISTEKQNRFFNIIQASSKQLLQLINDIVDISKIEANQLNISYEEFDINSMISELSEILQMELNKQNKEQEIEIITDCPNFESPFPIYSSPIRLKQIISNLLNNSIKFTQNGHIKLGYKKIGENHIQIFVEDTGIGISEQGKKIVFDRFMQATPETSKKYGGTGLGLFITKQLTGLLYGELSFKSELQKGTTFYIKIPISIDNNLKQEANKQKNIH